VFESCFKVLGQVTVGWVIENEGGASFVNQITAVVPGIAITSLV
jgi:hypothetical protein